MAEALRANVEALRRIDAGQRAMAEALEKSDKAHNVIASTRALNETFRGLTEIQRGLLDSVVKDRGRSRGLVPALAAIAVLAALLGALLVERMRGDDRVPRDLYMEQGRRVAALEAEVARNGAREAEFEAARRAWSEERDGLRASLADLERRLDGAERTSRELAAKNERYEKNLERYLELQDQADLAGALQVERVAMEKRIADLEQRLARSEGERERLINLVADAELAARSPDPEAILEAARTQGVLPAEAAPAPPQAGVMRFQRNGRRHFLRRFNELLAGQAYVLQDVAGIRDGARLLEVELLRYEGMRLLNTLRAAEMEVRLDRESGAVELRLFDGAIHGGSRPTEPVPFPEGGHSVFLAGVDAAAWLEGQGAVLDVAEDGRLTWRTGPP